MFDFWKTAYRARPRTWGAFAIMLAAGIALFWIDWPTRITLAWNAGALFYVVAVIHMAMTEDSNDILDWAERNDDGAVLILLITCLAAIVSLGAIAFDFAVVKPEGPLHIAIRIALAASTIILSWMMVHASFAVHYAHEYYGKDEGESRYGLLFPKRHHGDDYYYPDYWDFFYFSANLGAAAQTSDVQITSREMRRIVLAHTIVGYLFNTLIVALGVNLAASVIGG